MCDTWVTPDETTPHLPAGNSYYLFCETAPTRHAQAVCERVGADVISPRHLEEYKEVSSLLTNNLSDKERSLIMALNIVYNSGRKAYTWADGRPLDPMQTHYANYLDATKQEPGYCHVFSPRPDRMKITHDQCGFHYPIVCVKTPTTGEVVPSEVVTDTSYSFTLTYNNVDYILETSPMNTGLEADKYCVGHGMRLAQIEDEIALTNLGNQMAAMVEEHGITLAEVATGVRSSAGRDKAATINDFNAAAWLCAVFVPDGESFKLVGKLCNRERAVLCANKCSTLLIGRFWSYALLYA